MRAYIFGNSVLHTDGSTSIDDEGKVIITHEDKILKIEINTECAKLRNGMVRVFVASAPKPFEIWSWEDAVVTVSCSRICDPKTTPAIMKAPDLIQHCTDTISAIEELLSDADGGKDVEKVQTPDAKTRSALDVSETRSESNTSVVDSGSARVGLWPSDLFDGLIGTRMGCTFDGAPFKFRMRLDNDRLYMHLEQMSLDVTSDRASEVRDSTGPSVFWEVGYMRKRTNVGRNGVTYNAFSLVSKKARPKASACFSDYAKPEDFSNVINIDTPPIKVITSMKSFIDDAGFTYPNGSKMTEEFITQYVTSALVELLETIKPVLQRNAR